MARGINLQEHAGGGSTLAPLTELARAARALGRDAGGSQVPPQRLRVGTCARVARVIEREFSVTYHKDHVSRLLKALRKSAGGARGVAEVEKKRGASGARPSSLTKRASTCCPAPSALMRRVA